MTMIETEMIQSSLFQADQLTVSYHVEVDKAQVPKQASNPVAPKQEQLNFEHAIKAEIAAVTVGKSSDIVEAQAASKQETATDVVEINLADLHVPEAVSEAELVLEPQVVNTQFQMSLPAALCDELLIEEINSIPSKMGFKIGEVADMLAIKQYVLRYWESEFDVLKPKKAANNQRYYTRKDVENAYLIRKLLHRDRFSIEGARSAMKELKTFVRSEVKKEKAISNISQTLNHLDDRVEDLLLQIRKTADLFI